MIFMMEPVIRKGIQEKALSNQKCECWNPKRPLLNAKREFWNAKWPLQNPKWPFKISFEPDFEVSIGTFLSIFVSTFRINVGL